MTAQHVTGAPGTDAQGNAHFTAALLQATLQANRITALVSLAYDGPQILAYSVSLGLGEHPERVERMAGALAMAAGVDTCRVARAGGRLLLEVPRPPEERRTLRAGKLDALQAASATAVPLGMTTAGKVAWLDLADERSAHLVIGGTTGSGKTVALHWLLYRLCKQNTPAALRLILLDPKRRELQPFARAAHLAHPITSAPVDITRVLAWVASELDRRSATGQAAPMLLIVAEEVADLLATAPDVADLLARIAQIGRSLGVHLVATTQQPGAKSLGAALANFPARLLGRVASATLTYGAAGRARSQADQLLGRGDFLLLTAGDVARLQLPMIGRELGTLPHVDQVATLDDELPTLAEFADRARDPRGGHGRRELGSADYDAIDQALANGADVDDLRARFRIGYERARRILAEWEGRA